MLVLSTGGTATADSVSTAMVTSSPVKNAPPTAYRVPAAGTKAPGMGPRTDRRARVEDGVAGWSFNEFTTLGDWSRW